MIAHQNDVPAQREDFDDWVNLLDQVLTTARLDEIAREAGQLGDVSGRHRACLCMTWAWRCRKQNVYYAEVAIAPPDFIGSAAHEFRHLP